MGKGTTVADRSSSASRSVHRRTARAGSGLFGFVVAELGQAIVDGTIPAGEVLNADILTQRLDVSRSVVREGLRSLGSLGLVEARPQVGTRVLPSSEWNLLDPQIIAWRGASQQFVTQMHELLELRLGVEPLAARLAAVRMPEEDRVALRQAALDMESSLETEDAQQFFTADSLFHRLLLEGSGNTVIGQLADVTEAALQSRARVEPAAAELNTRSVRRHIALADAVIAGDPAGAEEMAKVILEETLPEFSP